MIEKVIENWLTNASEKSFQVPYAFMLIGKGHKILHITRHCSMELGKDILSMDRDGQLYAHQLKGAKGGRYRKADYVSGLTQLNELVSIPVTHPSVLQGTNHKSFLVVNGHIEEEVMHAIGLQNQQWQRMGLNGLQTTVFGEMLDMSLAIKDYLVPSEIPNIHLLFEMYLRPGEGFLDKKSFHTLISSILFKEFGSAAELKRLISASALLCAIALEKSYSCDNHIAIIEGWTIYSMLLFRLVESNTIDAKDITSEIALAGRQIEDRLTDLFNEIKEKPDDALVGNRAFDAMVYKYRNTILIGLVAELGRRAILKPDMCIDLAEVDAVLDKLSQHAAFWGDSAVPYLVSKALFFLAADPTPERAIKSLIHTLHSLTGALRTGDVLYFDCYYSAEQALLVMYDQTKDRRSFLSPSSYAQYPLLLLCAADPVRPALESMWKDISHCLFLDYQPAALPNYFLWHNQTGHNTSHQFQTEVSWNTLSRKHAVVNPSRVPSVLQKYPDWIPLFMMVYPHRFKSDLLLYYRDQLADRLNDKAGG